MRMTISMYMMVLLAFVASTAAQDWSGIAPSPMESGGAALGVPALLAAMASILAWLF